jgi:hypothetical protein
MTTVPIPPVNDEEPTDAAVARLWAALDAALGDPATDARPRSLRDHPGDLQCLRCGYRWTPRTATHPRCCPMPLCRSTYWDREPVMPNARRPADIDWVRVERQREINKRNRVRWRHLARLRQLASELDIDITDPAPRHTRKRGRPRAPTAAGIAATWNANHPVEPATPVPPPPEVIARWEAGRPTVQPFRRTVPPPPGIDDLEFEGGDKP